MKSILISCGARLAPFDIAELRDLMAEDELELDTLGDRKSALFVILSDTDSTFNFVAALMYFQLFNLLCDKADDFYGGRLPVHVRCLLDEFANIGQIPNFDKLIATIRSREISAALFQSQSQLKPSTRTRGYHRGNWMHLVFGRQGEIHLKEISECWARRQSTASINPRTGAPGFSRPHLSKRKGVDDTGRIGSYGRRQVPAAAGCAPFLSDKYDRQSIRITNTLPTPTRSTL